MTALQKKIDKIVNDFSKISNWEDRYKKIIAIGKAMPELPPDLKTDEAKVKGCQSQVWLHAQLSEDGKVQFQGDSDALIVRGLVGFLIQIYTDSTPEEILATPPDFLKELGFQENLSPSRTNGLFAMIKQIRNFATAFAVMLKMQGR